MRNAITIAQPSMGTTGHRLRTALSDPQFDRLDAAVAYVTSSGLRELRSDDEDRSTPLNERWLTSIDWYRSDPVALQALDQTAASSVRVHDGEFVVSKPGCVPKQSFHPKGFLFSGPDARMLISGSGNLSRNGLTTGVELETILEVRNPTTSGDRNLWNDLGNLLEWHEAEWEKASRFDGLEDRYKRVYKRARTPLPPTDDDSVPEIASRGYNASDLATIRRSTTFWTEAGNITPNRGAGLPGSQLMTRALTRVFFGFSGEPVQKQTLLGAVTIKYGDLVYPGESIEFAHNGMDRLNLPIPGGAGPPAYDRKTLIFRKVAYHGRVAYELSFANSAQARKALRTASQKNGLDLALPGGARRFGFIID